MELFLKTSFFGFLCIFEKLKLVLLSSLRKHNELDIFELLKLDTSEEFLVPILMVFYYFFLQHFHPYLYYFFF